ncbi:MAG TPA: hypothetical protein VKM55_20225 [Candidatus Lokiarchaeia archaeon]|nr:hypothetical protein [Candidatus Lokiarchaeia archaeon]
MAGNILDDVSSVMSIGFDMIAGPILRWKKDVDTINHVELDYDHFALATYLAFKGGNAGGPVPKAIVYDAFSVVGFEKGMDLVCLFLKNTKALEDISRLKEIATSFSAQMDKEDGADDQEPSTVNTAEDDGVKEIKRIICNMLRQNTLPTPEIRSHFKLTSSEAWAIMSALEHDGLVKRSGKDGRSVLWTLA